jgi:hypothetical protein
MKARAKGAYLRLNLLQWRPKKNLKSAWLSEN